jgi:hypothetical protein
VITAICIILTTAIASVAAWSDNNVAVGAIPYKRNVSVRARQASETESILIWRAANLKLKYKAGDRLGPSMSDPYTIPEK